MSGDFFLRHPRKDASERARLRAALHEEGYEYRYAPRRRIRFGGLFVSCLQLIVIGLVCGLMTACVGGYLLILALK